VYYDLDGGEAGLTAEIVAQLRRAYFVYAEDSITHTRSANATTMIVLGTRYATEGGVLAVNASRSGCQPGATWCLHDALVAEHSDNSAAVAYLSAPWNPPAPTPPAVSAP
jgi:hypothetical protein